MSVETRRVAPGVAGPSPRKIVERRSGADRVFRWASTGAGLLTLVILGLIGLFLFIRAAPAFGESGLGFLTIQDWGPDRINHRFGIVALLYWTVVIAVIALVIAVPLSIAVALFINEYVPRRLRRSLVAVVDLLAAVPSVIFGFWGLLYLMPHLVGGSGWLADNLGAIPIFGGAGRNFANSAFIAGIVLSLMISPICTSVMREVFSQTPPSEKEAALALGASRWAMIRTVVLPFGRGGIIGGSMLGLGRALGETIAVAMIVSPIFTVSPYVLHSGANSIAANIANQFAEATQKHGIPALMASGVTLFVVTLIVNFGASLVVRRSRSGRGVEI